METKKYFTKITERGQSVYVKDLEAHDNIATIQTILNAIPDGLTLTEYIEQLIEEQQIGPAANIEVLKQKVRALESLISDDVENPTEAIDKFQEIVDFLENFSNTGTLQEFLGNFKIKQTAVTDPTTSGNALQFIASFTQDENGDVIVTKKTVSEASAYQNGTMSSRDKQKLDNIETLSFEEIENLTQ